MCVSSFYKEMKEVPCVVNKLDNFKMFNFDPFPGESQPAENILLKMKQVKKEYRQEQANVVTQDNPQDNTVSKD